MLRRRSRRQRLLLVHQHLVPYQVRSNTVGAILDFLARAQPHVVAADGNKRERRKVIARLRLEGRIQTHRVPFWFPQPPPPPPFFSFSPDTWGFRKWKNGFQGDLFPCMHPFSVADLRLGATHCGKFVGDMTRSEACDGRSVRKDKDATRRLVAKRLAWLAKDSNWDGTLRPPPNKRPPPPKSGDIIRTCDAW